MWEASRLFAAAERRLRMSGGFLLLFLGALVWGIVSGVPVARFRRVTVARTSVGISYIVEHSDG